MRQMLLVKHQDLLCSCQKAALTLLHLGSTRAVCLSCTWVHWHTLLQGIHPQGKAAATPQLHQKLSFSGIFPQGAVQSTQVCHLIHDMQVGFPSETSHWECMDFPFQ